MDEVDLRTHVCLLTSLSPHWVQIQLAQMMTRHGARCGSRTGAAMVSSLASVGSADEDGVDNGEGEDDAVARRQGIDRQRHARQPRSRLGRLDARTGPFLFLFGLTQAGTFTTVSVNHD